VQNIFLAVSGMLALAVSIPAILGLARRHGLSDPRTQVSVAVLGGLMGAVLVASLRADLVPDELEAILAASVVAAGSLAVIILAWHGVRAR
jgi:hypothetical protein